MTPGSSARRTGRSTDRYDFGSRASHSALVVAMRSITAASFVPDDLSTWKL
jgi:hypothetical protein